MPAWSGGERRRLETRLRRLAGVGRVEANPATRNVLIHFDPAATNARTILAELRTPSALRAAPPKEPEPPPVLKEGKGRRKRARIAVRGLDRDPHLSRR